MTNEAKAALNDVLGIISGLTRSWTEEEEYSKFLQQLASDARKTGKSQSHRICEAPRVFDATPYWDRLRKLIKTEGYKELKNSVTE